MELDEEINKLRPTQRSVYETIRDYGPATDAEVADRLGMSGNTVRPRRRELADAGLVEPVRRVVSTGSRTVTVWGVVDAERVAEAKAIGAARRPRRKTVFDLSFEEQVEAARQLLSLDEVNEALSGSHGRAWSRARGRARETRRDAERDRRALKAQLEEAEREHSVHVHFLRAKRRLLENLEAVRAVRRFVDEDLQRRSRGDVTLISPGAWPEVADLVADVREMAEATTRRIEEALGIMGPEVIEGEAVVIETLELPPAATD